MLHRQVPADLQLQLRHQLQLFFRRRHHLIEAVIQNAVNAVMLQIRNCLLDRGPDLCQADAHGGIEKGLLEMHLLLEALAGLDMLQ